MQVGLYIDPGNAGSSTAFDAKNAPNFAQDRSIAFEMNLWDSTLVDERTSG
jgi:hypothetical protein